MKTPKLRPDTSDSEIWDQVFNRNEYGLPDTIQGVVVDIGAHIGSFAIRAALAGADVVAFEPDPDSFALLEENVARFGVEQKVIPFNAAVTACGMPGTAPLLRLGHHPAANMVGETGWKTTADVVMVRTLPFDSVLPSNVAVLKMDCEGAEWDILTTHGHRLWKVGRLAMELHSPQWKAEENRVGAHFFARDVVRIIEAVSASGLVPERADQVVAAMKSDFKFGPLNFSRLVSVPLP